MRVDNNKDLRVRVYGKTFGNSELEDSGVYKGLKDSGGSRQFSLSTINETLFWN